MTREAVIVAATRTAVGRAKKGTTRNLRPEDMGAAVIQELMRQVEGQIEPNQIDDVVLGCAMPEGAQGLNMARPVTIRAGLPVETPAQTINRFCSSGLQAIAIGAERIIANGADVVIAGGIESMSYVPMIGFNISPDPVLADMSPEVYLGMGLTAEHVADEYEVTREAQDEFAYHSHMKAAAAQDGGKSAEEIVPVEFDVVRPGSNGDFVRTRSLFDTDEHLRRETTLEALANLKPVFKQGGTVTAGNSSPLSDGAAGVIVIEAGLAAKLGLSPLARFVGFNVAGVRPEIMGIGPVRAVPRILARTGMKLQDIELIELNEAFAAQAVAVIRELRLNPDIVNVNGGAIALGHPLGCTGAKLTVQLIHELRRRRARYGMVTMCIGGGMGAAGVFENLSI